MTRIWIKKAKKKEESLEKINRE